MFGLLLLQSVYGFLLLFVFTFLTGFLVNFTCEVYCKLERLCANMADSWEDVSQSDSDGKKSKACSSCSFFMPGWDGHEQCCICSPHPLCSKVRKTFCDICADWSSATWTKYQRYLEKRLSTTRATHAKLAAEHVKKPPKKAKRAQASSNRRTELICRLAWATGAVSRTVSDNSPVDASNEAGILNLLNDPFQAEPENTCASASNVIQGQLGFSSDMNGQVLSTVPSLVLPEPPVRSRSATSTCTSLVRSAVTSAFAGSVPPGSVPLDATAGPVHHGQVPMDATEGIVQCGQGLYRRSRPSRP